MSLVKSNVSEKGGFIPFLDGYRLTRWFHGCLWQPGWKRSKRHPTVMLWRLRD